MRLTETYQQRRIKKSSRAESPSTARIETMVIHLERELVMSYSGTYEEMLKRVQDAHDKFERTKNDPDAFKKLFVQEFTDLQLDRQRAEREQEGMKRMEKDLERMAYGLHGTWTEDKDHNLDYKEYPEWAKPLINQRKK